MKKMFLLLMSATLVASLSHGTYSSSRVHAGCATLIQGALPADDDAKPATAIGSEDADMATAETAQQNEVQGASFPDRILHLVDTFAKLVMVI